jgi:hypothetical protein
MNLSEEPSHGGGATHEDAMARLRQDLAAGNKRRKLSAGPMYPLGGAFALSSPYDYIHSDHPGPERGKDRTVVHWSIPTSNHGHPRARHEEFFGKSYLEYI